MTNNIKTYKREFDSWDEMKSIIRRRFMSSHCYRELYQRLQSFNQSTKSVDEYLNRWNLLWFKLILMRINRLQWLDKNGFNCIITHIMELLHYVKLKEMVYMIIKVERQLKQKGTVWKSQLLDPLKPYRKYNIRYVPS